MKIGLLADLSATPYLAIIEASGKIRSSKICPGQKGDSVLEWVDICLEECNLVYADIEFGCVGIGPGSFTGVRVAIAAIEGLCFAKHLPIYSFSSLKAMWYSQMDSTLALIPGNSGNYFAAAEDLPEQVLSTEAILDISNKYATILIAGSIPAQSLILQIPHRKFFLENLAFDRIASLALEQEPIRNGIVKPNYVMASAAEQKREANG